MLNTLIQQILNSSFFSNTLLKSSKLLGKKGRLLQVVVLVLKQVATKGSIPLLGTVVISKFKLLAQLVYHYAKGNYRDIQKKSMIIVVATLVYFVSPFDLIPDFLPAVGYLDDITLLTYSIGQLMSELEKFEVWKEMYDKAEDLDFETIPVST